MKIERFFKMKMYDLKTITLCTADENYPRHSEASVAELANGGLTMVWQRFGKSPVGSNDTAPAVIAMMDCESGDPVNGEWTNLRVVGERIPGCVNAYSPNLIRRKDGSLMLMFMRYMRLAPGETSLANAYIKISYDDGATFGEERLVWERLPMTFSNDCLTRLPSGRLLLPVCHHGGAGWGKNEIIEVSTAYSDDDGENWEFSSHRVHLPMRGAMEPFVALCSDKRTLIMVMRNQLGSLMKCYSDDDGVTWTKPQTTGLSIPESCPYISNVPGSDTLLVIWNNAEYDPLYRSHYGRRTPLTIAFSDDDGKSFYGVTDIEDDPASGFSNPGVTWLSDGRCVLTYWTTVYRPDGRMGGPISLKLATFKVK